MVGTIFTVSQQKGGTGKSTLAAHLAVCWSVLGGKSVGTLAGVAGMAARLGAAGLPYLLPWLTLGGSYSPAFVIGAGLAVLALASVWLVCGRIEPLKPKKEQA